MLRAIFLALGAFLALLGAQCLAIDRFELRPRGTQEPSQTPSLLSAPAEPEGKVIEPPEWAAWSLMSIGVVTMLYAHTIPKRYGG